jgi:hypothetical protein
VLDKVTISYRGASYELGGGQDFFAIWRAGAPRPEPLERWPRTPEGWSAAWARFASIEAPGTIAPAGGGPGSLSARLRDLNARTALSAGTGAIIAAALLAVGVICGIVGLFPSYLSGASLAQQPAELVPHVIYLAGWTASAALILLGGTRLRMGALLAAGMSVVTFGFFFTDAGQAIAGGAHIMGAGLPLSLAGWLACAAGSVLALRIRPGGGALVRPHGDELGPVLLLMFGALGAAVAFAPSWDSYVLRTSSGSTQIVTAGNVFANPAPVIAGNVAVMIALVAAVVVAALWRPGRQGAVLLAGAAIPMVAQAISALVGVGEATSPTLFGISPAQASQAGLTISNGLTGVFWIYCAFVLVLVVSCAWMFVAPRPAVPQPPLPSDQAPGDVTPGYGTAAAAAHAGSSGSGTPEDDGPDA